eukprot:9209260-Prorocentrum_lima.AAC.1
MAWNQYCSVNKVIHQVVFSKGPEDMGPTIQLWMSMRDPEGCPMWVRYDGSTRRTSPYKVELKDLATDQ